MWCDEIQEFHVLGTLHVISDFKICLLSHSVYQTLVDAVLIFSHNNIHTIHFADEETNPGMLHDQYRDKQPIFKPTRSDSKTASSFHYSMGSFRADIRQYRLQQTNKKRTIQKYWGRGGGKKVFLEDSQKEMRTELTIQNLVEQLGKTHKRMMKAYHYG